ncbi:TPA: hypothetical protein ROX82_000552 [Bacillus thuringiensis]|uniref:hypothetical protein n=1 Tax=Bacillus cereus TaxID=1396 RepID=UPI00288EFF10|nr:hypothetical protein [Bacillus thuringiensis]HDX9513444.1 hypothetical protein [Bacillus thuringiensis]
MGASILAFLIACLLVWILKGNAKEQAKEARNELGRQLLPWIIFGVVAILILITVVAVHDSNVQQVQEDNSSYYTHNNTRDDTSDDDANDSYDNKYDCEKDMSGVWVDNHCIREPMPKVQDKGGFIALEAGEYVVGEDFPAGDYQLITAGREGNFFASNPSGETTADMFLESYVYNDWSCSDGDKIKTQIAVRLVRY